MSSYDNPKNLVQETSPNPSNDAVFGSQLAMIPVAKEVNQDIRTNSGFEATVPVKESLNDLVQTSSKAAEAALKATAEHMKSIRNQNTYITNINNQTTESINKTIFNSVSNQTSMLKEANDSFITDMSQTLGDTITNVTNENIKNLGDNVSVLKSNESTLNNLISSYQQNKNVPANITDITKTENNMFSNRYVTDSPEITFNPQGPLVEKEDEAIVVNNTTSLKTTVNDIKTQDAIKQEKIETQTKAASTNSPQLQTLIDQNAQLLNALQNLGTASPQGSKPVEVSNIPQAQSSGPAESISKTEVKETNRLQTIMSQGGDMNTMLLMQIVSLLSGGGQLKTKEQW